MPLIGYVDQISHTTIEGWACDVSDPTSPVSVSVLIDGTHRGTCFATISRAGLAGAADGPPRDECAFRFLFEPPLSPFVPHFVEVVETWSGTPLPNGQITLPRPCIDHSGSDQTPILVTSTGRSGSTMLMSELARHPDIVVGDRYPYEIKQIAYHAAAFRALVADGDRLRSTNPDTMLAPDVGHFIGANPYNLPGLFDLGTTGNHLQTFWQRRVPMEYARVCRTLIREFYATLAVGQRKQSARFFCEKGGIEETAVQGVRLFFGTVKDIVIIRDPRDLLCSSIAFWKLSPEDAMSMLRTTFPRLAKLAREAGPDTIVVRYEDLIRDPIRVRCAISDFLAVDLSVAPAAETIISSHRTSESPEASIGRWRGELSRQQIDACETAFGSIMREFDYEASDGWAGSFELRHPADDNPMVVAEGPGAVTAFFQSIGGPKGNSTTAYLVFELRFGEGTNGAIYMIDGWASPERRWVWSCARESQIRLPAIRGEGNYRLHVVVLPFIHGEALSAQRVTVIINGHEMGTARVSALSALAVDLSAVESGTPVVVTLRFPDAISPATLHGEGDTRMLGCSLHLLTLHRISA